MMKAFLNNSRHFKYFLPAGRHGRHLRHFFFPKKEK